MKLRTTLLLLLLTGLVLALIVTKERRQPTTKENLALSTHPFPFKPEEADEIEMTRKGEKLRLAKHNGMWRIGQPFEDAADPELVKQLLDAVTSVKWVETVKRDELRTSELKRTGLADDSASISVKGEGGLLAQASFGGPAPLEGCVYAGVPSYEGAIHVAETNLPTLINKSNDEWRDPRILHFKLEEVRGFSISAGGGGMEFARNVDGEPWMLLKPIRTRASAGRVEAVLRAFLNLKVKPAKVASPATTPGPELPVMTVSFDCAGRKKPLALTLHPSHDPSSEVRVQSDGRNGVFLAPPKAADFWRLQPNDLRDQNLVRIPGDQVAALRIHSPAHTDVVLNKEGNTWMLTRFGKKEPANQERVTRLINTLNATPVAEFLSDTGGNLDSWGLEKPFLSIEWQAGGKTSTLDFGQSAKSFFTARLRDEPFVYRPKTIQGGFDLFTAIPPDSLRWRSTKIVNVSVLSVRRLIVVEGDKPPLMLVHNPNATWQGTIAGHDVTPQVDTARANQLLQKLAELQASDWNSDRTAAIAALQNPSLTVQLLIADRLNPDAAPSPVVLTFAPLQPGMDTAIYHGRRDDNPDTFFISKELYHELTAQVLKGQP